MDCKDRIKFLREKKKMSQKKFGEQISLSQNHVCSIEKGSRNITERTINDICKTFKVNTEWLLSGYGEMYVDEIEKFNIKDKEIKSFMKKFIKVDKATQEYVKTLIENRLRFLDKEH